MPQRRQSTVWRRNSGPRPGRGRRRRISGRLEWVCFQSISILWHSICGLIMLSVPYAISPFSGSVSKRKKKSVWKPSVRVLGVWLTFVFLPCSYSMRMASAGFMMNLFWREWHHYDTSTSSPKQPSLRKELFYNSPFMWSLGMTDEWTFKQLCILEMNDKNRLCTSKYKIKKYSFLANCTTSTLHCSFKMEKSHTTEIHWGS